MIPNDSIIQSHFLSCALLATRAFDCSTARAVRTTVALAEQRFNNHSPNCSTQALAAYCWWTVFQTRCRSAG